MEHSKNHRHRLIRPQFNKLEPPIMNDLVGSRVVGDWRCHSLQQTIRSNELICWILIWDDAPGFYSLTLLWDKRINVSRTSIPSRTSDQFLGDRRKTFHHAESPWFHMQSSSLPDQFMFDAIPDHSPRLHLSSLGESFPASTWAKLTRQSVCLSMLSRTLKLSQPLWMTALPSSESANISKPMPWESNRLMVWRMSLASVGVDSLLLSTFIQCLERNGLERVVRQLT
jgi:hypothetical protein